jgi:carbohydrate kinase (thermoresistant glucokinase family)
MRLIGFTKGDACDADGEQNRRDQIMTNRIIIFMGVSGSGKTTLANRVADDLPGAVVLEGDSFHLPQMKEKMRAGTPLSDEDRWPWLGRIKTAAIESVKQQRAVIVTCSALKKTYRNYLREGLGDNLCFVFLDVAPDILAMRHRARQHEYMSPLLLESQLATLERPTLEDGVIKISGDLTEAESVAEIMKHLL